MRIGSDYVEVKLHKTQKYLDWLKTKLFLDKNSITATKRKIERGQVYWCNFGMNIGSEMSKETPRPCLIIQNDLANLKSPNTIVVPITHNKSMVSCLVHIEELQDEDNNIILDGKINVSNVVCVSKARLGDYIATLSNKEIKSVDESMARQIGLYEYYNKILLNLNDKVNYLKKVKQQRNYAEDTLLNIKNKLGITKDVDIIGNIDKLLDNQR